ncbi:hypothetical protein [Gracilibacillus dipsosauri]|uniref:hypothetical protein n=1 Tax=Gracilibacillus dipsosauri TaxID=178340 RepID=UPI00240A1253
MSNSGDVKLITGECTTRPDKNLIDEYNEIQQKFNEKFYQLSLEEVLRMHRRAYHLQKILVEEQLTLF